jgi:hypothetical protein
VRAQEPEKMLDPATEAHVLDELLEDSAHECVVPEIFSFNQSIVFHTGNKPHYPGHRRVSLTVHVRDLQARYGLTDAALQTICQVRFRFPFWPYVCGCSAMGAFAG